MQKQIWLIGAGPMAIEYATVLKAQQTPFITIGRGTQSATTFYDKTGLEVVPGGLEAFLKTKPVIPPKVIVATGVETLFQNCLELIESGVKEILCEKPGGLNALQVKNLSEKAEQNSVKIYLAYNRRFYSSVKKAKEIILKDGGVSSFNFEFTEWAHVISPLVKAEGIKENWFLANSTHVVDLAFYLGGKPKEICCFNAGGLAWHPAASIFTGAGISVEGTLFNYQANWEAPGRWAVEILTKNHRLYFKPMEKLQIQKTGSVQVEFVELDDSLDINFKPGLYLQTEAFLKNDFTEFISIHEQLSLMPIYNKMAGYTD
ncbi:MAG: gfo/Idh/MocA family oxidoreductase [Bacteroidales bacterium]|nr:gfo/Idh/MocA family oxidoreductase [Bacteroidales bacterium]